MIPMLTFFFMIIKNIFFSKNTEFKQKQILLMIALHILFDFDLQFLSIFLILIICLDWNSEKKIKNDFSAPIAQITIMLVIIAVYVYFAICTFANYIGNNKFSLELYEKNTFAKIDSMKSEENIEKQNEIADEILKQNKMCYQAYNVKASYYFTKRDFEKMIENKKKAIEIDKYQITEYEEYIVLLSKAIEYSLKKDNLADANTYMQLVLEVPKRLEEIQESFNSLAFKIKDKPNLKLNENIENYIKIIKESVS